MNGNRASLKAAALLALLILAGGAFLPAAALAQAAEPGLMERAVEAVTPGDTRPQLVVDIPSVNFSPAVVEDGYVDIPWLAEYIAGVYRYMLGIGALLAAFMMVFGGFIYLTSGDSGRISQAKTYITNAALGLAVLIGSYVLLQTVNPDLTKLNALRVARVGQELFVPNETDPDDLDPGQSSPPSFQSAAGSAVGQVPYVGQYSFRDTPYLDKNGLCTVNPGIKSPAQAGKPYTVASSGCGVVSAAMVISYHTGQSASGLVPTLAQEASARGYRPCDDRCECFGTSTDLFRDDSLLSGYGLKGYQVRGGEDGIRKELLDGNPVIMMQRAGLFGGGGHYIVVIGINEDGTFAVNDPGKNPRSPYTKDRSGGTDLPSPISQDSVPGEWVFKSYSSAWVITER